MDKQHRKAAVAAYKERKAAVGVYAVIRNATGEAWVGCSRHVDTQKNGLWFALRQGTSPFPSLQKAWACHGEADFRFEELDRLADDFPELGRMSEVKKRQSLWQARLRASAI
jgi:hypothetical protein